MLEQVFNALKNDSKKEDFVELTDKDRKSLNIDMTNEEIKVLSIWKWKGILKKKTNIAALKYLLEENSRKEKTKDIHFEKLEMSPYLQENERKSISTIIFSIRSQTLQIKEFHPWKHEDNDMCVKCQKFQETMDHFATCTEYETEMEPNWRDIKKNDMKRQKEIGNKIHKRIAIRESILKKIEDGQASLTPGSTCSNV